MLRQVVMQIAPVHQVEDKAQLVGSVERIGHADDEGAVHLEFNINK